MLDFLKSLIFVKIYVSQNNKVNTIPIKISAEFLENIIKTPTIS